MGSMSHIVKCGGQQIIEQQSPITTLLPTALIGPTLHYAAKEFTLLAVSSLISLSLSLSSGWAFLKVRLGTLHISQARFISIVEHAFSSC
jgi:hypothetical protein